MSEFSRPCSQCGKIHDTGMQDMETGEMIQRIDPCYDCFMKLACITMPITDQICLQRDMS